ncbi:hypothetical protein [Chryseobacterium sp. sg2396]|uniref:hypothetical protein n=2 Tax=Chryseobacterium TaxID=59732 RepID=UPI0025F20235|nr:hypothetical protein [uncultured Chryseobacterium sp.]
MKMFFKGIIFFILLVITFSCESVKNTQINSSDKNKKIEKGSKSLIIYYNNKISKTDLVSRANAYGADVFYQYENINAIAVSIPDNKTISDAENFFSSIKGVVQVSRDGSYQISKPQ